MFTFKAGLGSDHMPSVSVKTAAPGIFILTPNGGLSAGEYMVTFN